MGIILRLSMAFFALASCADQSIHFAVIGDYGVDNQYQAAVADLVKRNWPDFILTVGDNNYPDGCENTIDENIGKYYHEYIYRYRGRYGEGSLTPRFYPSLGNHDWYAKKKCPARNGLLPYVNYFTLPGNERYYDFVEGPVHFFALDSDSNEPDGIKRSSKQYRWFKGRVQRSAAPFKVVYFHHSPYSSGPHGDNKDMQWDFHDLDVDVVISGHDHIYERRIKNGVIYLVNGLGGAKPYDIESSEVAPLAVYNEKHGALFVTATETSLTMKFVNHEDNVIDRVILRKNSSEQQEMITNPYAPLW